MQFRSLDQPLEKTAYNKRSKRASKVFVRIAYRWNCRCSAVMQGQGARGFRKRDNIRVQRASDATFSPRPGEGDRVDTVAPGGFNVRPVVIADMKDRTGMSLLQQWPNVAAGFCRVNLVGNDQFLPPAIAAIVQDLGKKAGWQVHIAYKDDVAAPFMQLANQVQSIGHRKQGVVFDLKFQRLRFFPMVEIWIERRQFRIDFIKGYIFGSTTGGMLFTCSLFSRFTLLREPFSPLEPRVNEPFLHFSENINRVGVSARYERI